MYNGGCGAKQCHAVLRLSSGIQNWQRCSGVESEYRGVHMAHRWGRRYLPCCQCYGNEARVRAWQRHWHVASRAHRGAVAPHNGGGGRGPAAQAAAAHRRRCRARRGAGCPAGGGRGAVRPATAARRLAVRPGHRAGLPGLRRDHGRTGPHPPPHTHTPAPAPAKPTTEPLTADVMNVALLAGGSNPRTATVDGTPTASGLRGAPAARGLGRRPAVGGDQPG